MSEWQPLLAQALADNSLVVDEFYQNKLIEYLKLLRKWNKVFNLTTIVQPRDMVYLHLIDSLLLQPFLKGVHCLDVGSGAGLPGIPLAMLNPQQQWVLLDKNSKKTRFLTQTVAELGLKNVKVVHAKVEDFKAEAGFDSMLARALSTIHDFLESGKHLMKEDGIFIAMKGRYPQDELNELPDGFKLRQVQKVLIKGMDITRHIVVLAKEE